MTETVQLLAALTDVEKVALTSGRDIWTTTPIERLGIPSIRLGDGPHGVRKPRGDADQSMFDSHPATCFPTAALLGATWDPDLVRAVGVALGKEAASHQVAVLLGPGVNIKRTPVGGRNFEYFSEDPYLTARLGGAWVQGVQETGVGASLKHYVANDTEQRRYGIDAIVDDRALREIYLAAFESIVREQNPATIMAAYNRVNGTHCTEHTELIHDVLRGEWGYQGVVVSDWGAAWDRTLSIPAGTDLAMPGLGQRDDRYVLHAVQSGKLSREDLDTAVARILRLVQRHQDLAERASGEATGPSERDRDAQRERDAPRDRDAQRDLDAPRDLDARQDRDRGNLDAHHDLDAQRDLDRRDLEAHHDLARRVAAAGTVLLTNNGTLPLARGSKIALIGAFADEPRFQGAGSSHVVPTRVETLRQALVEAEELGTVRYVDGYDRHADLNADDQRNEAVVVAREADIAVVVVGLPETFETEGVDRRHLRLPDSHNRLVQAVRDANPRTVVVLLNGSPVEMPWRDDVCAIIEGYLGGQAGGPALADVLLGRVDPGGRLAETFPARYADHPVSHFRRGPVSDPYRESVYVGYRWFDSARVDVAFPFGHGLSYTTFEWSNFSVERGESTNQLIRVHVTVTNNGTRSGSEVVQLYVHVPSSRVFRPEQELKAFQKVHLEPGESADVVLEIGSRALAWWSTEAHDWVTEPGEVELRLARSSRNVVWSSVVTVGGASAPAAEDEAVGAAGVVAAGAVGALGAAGESRGADGGSRGADGGAGESRGADEREAIPLCYREPSADRGFPQRDFAILLGLPVAPHPDPGPGWRTEAHEQSVLRRAPFTLDTAVRDMRHVRLGRLLRRYLRRRAVAILGAPSDPAVEKVIDGVVGEFSFRMFPSLSGGAVSRRSAMRMLALVNMFSRRR